MKNAPFVAIVTFLLMLAVSFAFARRKMKAQFGGVATCKSCHFSKKSGAQFKVWQSGPHAGAFETLKSNAAIKIAKGKGLGEPSTEAACLKCHVTAHGVAEEFKGSKLTLAEGISCEACHGAGSEYKGRNVMKNIYTGKVDGSAYGLVKPTEEVCATCHNSESPTFKGFNFVEYSKRIAHPTIRNK